MLNNTCQSDNGADIKITEDHKDKRAVIKSYATAALVVTLATVILRTVCLFFFYDHDIGYYSRGFLPTALNVICFISTLAFLSAILVVKADTPSPTGKEHSLFICLASVICVVAFAVYFAVSIFSTSLVVFSELFDLLSKLTALMGIVYFAINIFCRNSNKKIHSLLGFGIIIWCIYAIAISYFDIYVQLNSPEKTTLHLALISVMIFIVSELRCFLLEMKKGFYLFSMCTAALFCGMCSIPTFVYSLIKGQFGTSKYFVYEAVVFAIGIYAVARLVLFAFSKKGCADEQNILVESNSEEGDEEV